MTDAQYMKRALRLAKRGRTSPNPMVGAVLVKGGRIIAEDFHRRAGTPHAEALVLNKAGKNSRGATLYVTLEPCCHTDKRTPPCTRAIMDSGLRKVVAAMYDPNPRVSGRGAAALERAGIAVSVGLLEKEAASLNEAYVKFITTGRPFVILKTAMTLDGKIATPEGQSRWITGQKARRLVHRVRGSVDAILTAIGTVRADNPELTVRTGGHGPYSDRPLRVVIDPALDIPPDSKILKVPPRTVIITNTADDKAKKLQKSGIEVIHVKGKLELNRLMQRLAGMGVMSVLIEGGSSLNAHALEEGVVDRVMFFIAPKIIGGRDSFTAVGGRSFRRLEDACLLRDVRVKRVGPDVLIEGYVNK